MSEVIDQDVNYESNALAMRGVFPSEYAPEGRPLKLGYAKVPLVPKKQIHRVSTQDVKKPGPEDNRCDK